MKQDLTSQFDQIAGTTTPPKRLSAPTPDIQSIYSQFDKIAGKTTPTTVGGGGASNVSRSQEILNLANKAQAPQNPFENGDFGVLGQVANAATQSEQNLGQDIGHAIRGKADAETIQSYQTNAQTLSDLASKQTDPALKQKYASMAASMLADGQQAGLDLKGRTPEQIVGDILGTAVDVGGALTGVTEIGALAKGGEGLSLGQKVLQGAKVGAITTGALGVGQGTAQGLQQGGDFQQVARSALTNGVIGAGGGAILGAGVSALPELIGKGQEAYQGAKDAIGGILKGGKTEEQILATAPEDVVKLKPSERQIWYQNEQDKINTQAETTTNQIKQDLQAKAESSTQKAKDLIKQLGTASNEKVVAIRPKAVELLYDQGQIFRGKIEEGMAGKGGIKVDMGELANYVDNNTATPEEAAQLKQALGVKNTPEQLPGQAPFKNETKTLQEVYDQTKSLKSGISKASVKGSKVFSPADMNTQKAVSMLTGFMQDQGVDFTEANKFWKQWAPIRDQLVSQGKIFNQSGTQSGTLARVLKNVALEKDPANTNFVSTLEEHMGPINDENKAIVAQMDANQKQALADKVAAEERLAENKLNQESANKKLQSSKIEIERQANSFKNTILKKIIKGVVAGGSVIEGTKLAITKHL